MSLVWRSIRTPLPNGHSWFGTRKVGTPAEDCTGLLADAALEYPDDLLRTYIADIPGDLYVNEDGSFIYSGTIDKYVYQDIYVNGILTLESQRYTFTESTEPVLTSPQAYGVSSQGCIPSVVTNKDNGTLYIVAVPDGDIPSVDQIKTGKQSSGSNAIYAATQTVGSIGIQFASPISILLVSTAYELYFVHTDRNDNDSEAVTIGFTTNAAISGGTAIQLPTNYFFRRQ